MNLKSAKISYYHRLENNYSTVQRYVSSIQYIKALEYELERQKTVINELLFEKESSK